MNEFKVIELMNQTQLEVLKDKNEDYDIYEKIQKLLQDEALFFKISKSNAYKIFQMIGIRKESFEEVYNKLIAKPIFHELVYKGKIDVNDQNLVVKY
mgnify:CR=1 FL=1